MSPNLFTDIIVVAVTAIFTTAINQFFNRRKNKAQSEHTEIENVKDTIEIWEKAAKRLQEEIECLQGEICNLKTEIGELRAENEKLRVQIDELKNKQLQIESPQFVAEAETGH